MFKSSFSHLTQSIHQRNTTWREQGLARHSVEFSTAQDPESRIDGYSRLLFSSSNYLGLATHPAVTTAAKQAIDTYGMGSGGSRLTTGTTALHNQLERELSDWLGYEDTVFFATGFQTNLAVLGTLIDSNTTVFSDEKNHASIIDGIRMARATNRGANNQGSASHDATNRGATNRGATLKVFPHRDYATLEELLREDANAHRQPNRNQLIVSDGVFSMDGTTADIPAIMALARKYGAFVVIDDAHGVGTQSADGRGTCHAQLGDNDDWPHVLIGTASKALGTEGGFACTSAEVAELLRNQGRSYVFSTANSAPQVAATVAAVGVLKKEEGKRLVGALQRNGRRVAQAVGAATKTAPHETAPHETAPHETASHGPIIPIEIGDEATAMRAAEKLKELGFHVPAIRYPTVPRGRAILRVTVMATHTDEQIDALIAAVRSVGTSLALAR